jgi:hypothetical protein
MSALQSFNDKYLSVAQSALSMLNTIGIDEFTLPQQMEVIGQAIAGRGFNPRPDYGASIASRWGRLSKYISCAGK